MIYAFRCISLYYTLINEGTSLALDNRERSMNLDKSLLGTDRPSFRTRLPALAVGVVVLLSCAAGGTYVLSRYQQGETKAHPTELSFDEKVPKAGDVAPNFTLKDLESKPFRLDQLLSGRPMVLEFGSVTCPYCANQIGSMEELAQRYAGRVDFVFVYCKEGHPQETDQPIRTFEERLAQARMFAREMKLKQKILVDEFDENSVQKLYGDLANPAFVLDVRGRVVKKFPLVLASEVDAYLSAYLANEGQGERER
jgi:thiol-disulfide isomerase/thioredoxin